MDCSLPGTSVHGIFKARILEWVAISSSRGSTRPRDQTWVSRIVGRRFIVWAAAAAAKSLQSGPTLCDPTDSSPPGSTIPGILQARTLEWVAISFSNAWKWKVKVKSLSGVRLFATAWTAAYQAPLSMGFSRQEYWSGVPLPSPTSYILPYCNWFFTSTFPSRPRIPYGHGPSYSSSYSLVPPNTGPAKAMCSINL